MGSTRKLRFGINAEATESVTAILIRVVVGREQKISREWKILI